MAADTSSVGKHLAELFNELTTHKTELGEAEQNVKRVEALIATAKSKIAQYLKDEDIYDLIAPNKLISPEASKPATAKPKADGTARKPRTKPDDLKAQYERNKAMYKPKNYENYNGVNPTTGLPVLYKGKSGKNIEIEAQKKDDERDFEAKQQLEGNELSEPQTDSQELVEEAPTPKPATSKKKAPAAA